jgi:uncharacterized protein
MVIRPFPQERSPLAAIGVGFKPQHFEAIVASPGQLDFFEVHAENYMGAGGPPHAQLATLRRDHTLSVHGVGLSVGGEAPLDLNHVARLKAVCDRYEPALVSEHLAWSRNGASFLNDLLPLPLDATTLARTIAHVDQLQATLQRRVLIENPATYLRFSSSTIDEPDFLAELARRTGCGLLLDVNNIYVSAANHGFDPMAYIDAFPLEAVGEIHLAGHSVQEARNGALLLIDTHGTPIADPVYALYAQVIARTGPIPSLVERDNDVPDWPELLAEAERTRALLAATAAQEAA